MEAVAIAIAGTASGARVSSSAETSAVSSSHTTGGDHSGRFARATSSTQSRTFSVPSIAEYGLIPKSLCVIWAVASTRLPSGPTRSSKRIGRVADPIVRSPLTMSTGPMCSTFVERKRIAAPRMTFASIVPLMSARSLSDSDVAPLKPQRTRSERGSAVSSSEILSPATASVPSHVVTSMTRSCPAFAYAPSREVRTCSVPVSGPSGCRPSGSIVRRP